MVKNVIPKSKTKLYKRWHSVMMRCYCKTMKDYYKYGGRGIKVCTEWHIYDNFMKWAINNGYDSDAPHMQCQLDRIDNDGDYCPENCRFADAHTQRMNQRLINTNMSGYIGIKYHKSGTGKIWQVGITVNHKYKHLGSFATKKEALEARNKYIIDNNLTEYKVQQYKGE